MACPTNNPSRRKLTQAEKPVYNYGYTRGEQDARAADVGLRVDNDTPAIRKQFEFMWERLLLHGKARQSQQSALWQTFQQAYHDGLGKHRKRNPLFLPKSLFDRYEVRDGSEKLGVAQTLAGAKKLVVKTGKKRPCSPLSVYSQNTGQLIQSYRPSNGQAVLKLDRDISKQYAEKAKETAKSAMKFMLKVGGREYATYDTKQDADEAVRELRKDKREKGKSMVVKAVAANPLTGKSSRDIPKLRHEGYSRRQAVAIALDTQRRKGMRNPDPPAGRKLGDLYEEFHGRPAEGETIYEETYFVPDGYEELGPLVELWVVSIHSKNGKAVKIVAPDPDTASLADVVKLCGSPEGNQLYFAGGDQEIDIKALGFSDSEERHHMMIGVLCEVTYRTEKKFHKFKLTDYYHGLGEETGNEPFLMYDPYSCKISVAGGDYHIKDVGIVN